MSEFTDGYYQSSDGLRLFYRDFHSQSENDLDPVICLPGLTRNSRDFEDLASLLSKRRRVITTDLRGRGRSEHDPDRNNYHPAQYVADIWILLEQLGMPKVAVVGTSLGGLMIMGMAHARSSAISAAVMNDIGPEIDPVGVARVVAGAGTLLPVASWDEAVEQVSKFYAHAFPDWSQSKWRKFTHTTYQQTKDGGFDIRLDRNIGVAAREGVSGPAHDPWQLFDALLSTPLLVIRGGDSDILSAATLEKMQQRKTDLMTVIVPNRGHAPNLDEPEAIDAIEKFLDA